ncbi:hypothetical protein, unlikely [Trypanosoma brucei brucei TREU927]|uniref:Uncharacterized protein n=1 Tax=Trypanosoma brucei brucei (strain 927/4 GUTat10.1) TaxID=185431 RepID=Q38EX1_TRYB2|nr:hypothetical protein, unlikely [Trypanosoma brucei brucei TREU927]EAN76649.1 hypothetical protein, unlikely [Trypanosoma brucei brucei TREU927]
MGEENKIIKPKGIKEQSSYLRMQFHRHQNADSTVNLRNAINEFE